MAHLSEARTPCVKLASLFSRLRLWPREERYLRLGQSGDGGRVREVRDVTRPSASSNAPPDGRWRQAERVMQADAANDDEWPVRGGLEKHRTLSPTASTRPHDVAHEASPDAKQADEPIVAISRTLIAARSRLAERILSPYIIITPLHARRRISPLQHQCSCLSDSARRERHVQLCGPGLMKQCCDDVCFFAPTTFSLSRLKQSSPKQRPRSRSPLGLTRTRGAIANLLLLLPRAC